MLLAIFSLQRYDWLSAHERHHDWVIPAGKVGIMAEAEERAPLLPPDASGKRALSFLD